MINIQKKVSGANLLQSWWFAKRELSLWLEFKSPGRIGNSIVFGESRVQRHKKN